MSQVDMFAPEEPELEPVEVPTPMSPTEIAAMLGLSHPQPDSTHACPSCHGRHQVALEPGRWQCGGCGAAYLLDQGCYPPAP